MFTDFESYKNNIFLDNFFSIDNDTNGRLLTKYETAYKSVEYNIYRELFENRVFGPNRNVLKRTLSLNDIKDYAIANSAILLTETETGKDFAEFYITFKNAKNVKINDTLIDTSNSKDIKFGKSLIYKIKLKLGVNNFNIVFDTGDIYFYTIFYDNTEPKLEIGLKDLNNNNTFDSLFLGNLDNTRENYTCDLQGYVITDSDIKSIFLTLYGELSIKKLINGKIEIQKVKDEKTIKLFNNTNFSYTLTSYELLRYNKLSVQVIVENKFKKVKKSKELSWNVIY